MKPWTILLTIIFLISCEGKDDIPGDIMPREKMQQVLWDMIQADQFSIQFLSKDSAHHNVKEETRVLYADVLKIHHVKEDEFEKSYQFYLSRPDITKTMLDSLSNYAIRQRNFIYNRLTPLMKSHPKIGLR